MNDIRRILHDLHLGVSQLPYDMLVRNKAGDVLALINHANAETLRADKAEADLAALRGQDEPTVLAPRS